ncbi:MAG: hypothetical protein L0Z62_34065 [Gemmataceae bacterium]|nr:hypothetical protein [Gemmataceae bacterium]
MRLMLARYGSLAAIGAALLAFASLSLIGCGLGRNSTTTKSAASLGEPLQEDVPTVCTGCLSEEKVGETVAVAGNVVQQCPASGCWFRLKDDAGEVFVDLAPAKLRLTEDRVGQQAQVYGHVVKSGGGLRLEARYVEFAPSQKDTASKPE